MDTSLQTPGELLIILALALNFLAGLAFWLVARGKTQWLSLARRAYHVFVGFTVLASAYLYYLFFIRNDGHGNGESVFHPYYDQALAFCDASGNTT
jgi:hypothetical protein